MGVTAEGLIAPRDLSDGIAEKIDRRLSPNAIGHSADVVDGGLRITEWL